MVRFKKKNFLQYTYITSSIIQLWLLNYNVWIGMIFKNVCHKGVKMDYKKRLIPIPRLVIEIGEN